LLQKAGTTARAKGKGGVETWGKLLQTRKRTVSLVPKPFKERSQAQGKGRDAVRDSLNAGGRTQSRRTKKLRREQ